jgi:hypothetical protein
MVGSPNTGRPGDVLRWVLEEQRRKGVKPRPFGPGPAWPPKNAGEAAAHGLPWPVPPGTKELR